jgi:FkbM family methyltransferase
MKAIKNWVKRTPAAMAIYRPISWRIHVIKDQWATRYWNRTHEVTTPFGFKLRAGAHPAYEQMRLGVFEREETAAILNELQTSDVFVDVGANLGYYTLMARQQGKPVVAFEPQAQNLHCLYSNLIANDWQDGVEVFPLALAETPGILTLYGASGPSASLVKGWAGYSSRFQQSVAVSTLDHILGGRFAGCRLLIKIDVEGAEYGVLRGAVATLSRMPRPAWLVEICLNEYHPSGNPDFRAIFDIFCDHGYLASTPEGVEVTADDVAKWAAAGTTGGGFNYLFR